MLLDYEERKCILMVFTLKDTKKMMRKRRLCTILSENRLDYYKRTVIKLFRLMRRSIWAALDDNATSTF